MSWISKIKSSAFDYVAIKAGYVGNAYRKIPWIYDGEKSPLEQGAPVEMSTDYYSIRKRAIKQFTKNGYVKNLVSKYELWLVGTGLTVSSAPDVELLEKKGVVIPELDKWTDYNDKLFNLWAKQMDVSLDRKHNLHGLARLATRNAGFAAGDMLTFCQYDKKRGITVELIDGGFIKNPPHLENDENTIQGITLNSANEMIMFHVEQSDNKWKTIKAYNKNGQKQAWMIFGDTGKLSDVRGTSRLSQSLDYTKKIDELAEALIKAAKENANTFMSIEHGANSTGNNPMKPGAIVRKNQDANTIACDTPEMLQRKVARSSEGDLLNLGIDQGLKRFNGEGSNSDSSVFHANMTDNFYSNQNLPPEVAKNLFGGSYSSSRAVSKTWEIQFTVERETLLVEQFYDPIYTYWFEIMIALGEIEAPVYFQLDSLRKAAYRLKSFNGLHMPHIDPLKEILAQRKVLGPAYDNVPLGTLAQGIDNISNSDSTQVIKKAEKELENVKNFNKFIPDEEKPSTGGEKPTGNKEKNDSKNSQTEKKEE